ncbi:MAG: transcriptional regulator [Mesorhizobium sp.]|nr:transcriptional regulator [Mesorhizobium sp.]RWK54298.1 MAG: transcriptional regulator [Mesorhizobium sp.]TIP42659.1 MAG: transcriptional regulator [Mesorhizobium sp.]
MIDASQIRAARSLLGWSQNDLVAETRLSLTTVRRMEDSAIGPGRSSAENVSVVQKALEAAGVQFIPENGGGAGVRLAKPGTKG